MLIITAAKDDGRYGVEYSQIIAQSKLNAAYWGVNFHQFPLEPGQEKLAHFKPRLLLDGLELDWQVVWVDGDACFTHPFPTLPSDLDLGFCIKNNREDPEPINTGVIFAQNKERIEPFIQKWERHQTHHTDPGQHDQWNLCQMLKKEDPLYATKRTFEMFGARIRIFPCLTYNAWHYRKDIDPYVVHFKGKNRSSFYTWMDNNQKGWK